MLGQVRPSGNYPLDFGVFLQDFVQAGGQDRVLAFCKSFIISSLLFFVKGFEPLGAIHLQNTYKPRQQERAAASDARGAAPLWKSAKQIWVLAKHSLAESHWGYWCDYFLLTIGEERN